MLVRSGNCSASVLMCLPFLDTSYKWSYIICNVLLLASLTWQNVFEGKENPASHLRHQPPALTGPLSVPMTAEAVSVLCHLHMQGPDLMTPV